MKKFLLAICTAMLCTVAALCAACGGGAKQPEKLKDGIALTLTEGESKNIDLSEYISIEGGGYSYEATSSQQNIATVAVEGNIAKVTAVSEGNATVTASAGEVTVDFAVTVNKKQPVTPVEVDKSALEAELKLEVSEQGDYTEESYAAYVQKLEAAKAVNAKADATQTEVDTACDGLKNARLALTERVPEAKADAEKTLEIVSGKSSEITLSDYIDGKNLSQLTYEVSSGNTLVTVSEITEGKFTVTAGGTEENIDVDLDICVKYKGESKLTVTITLQVKSEPQPVVKHTHVTKSVDVYALENKDEFTIDFTENIESNGVEGLVYSVVLNGANVTLDGNNGYAYPLTGSYGETATNAVFTVTVSYGGGKSVGYEYTLKITDTTAYRIVNGGFETGDLTGWTLTNQKLGAVSNETHYWKNDEESEQGYAFGLDGNYMFSAYATDVESAMGTLTSSPFKIGGSGWITYKLGGAKNADKVFLDIIEKDTGNILARFGNAFWQDRTENVKSGCTLISYKADLSANLGKTAFIRISDNAVRDYGLFFVDSFVTYYSEAPADGNAAVALTDKPDNIYQMYNGGFETGNLSGWELVEGEHFGAVSNDEKYFQDVSYGKDGDYLFTGANAGEHGTNGEWEAKTGVLRSGLVVIKAGATLSFKLGGGNKPEVGIRVVKFVENSEGAAEKVVVASYTNVNQADGSQGALNQYSYQLTDITEETDCYIEIFDNATGGWGLVTVDSIAITYAE